MGAPGHAGQREFSYGGGSLKSFLSFLWSNRYTLGLVGVMVLGAGWMGFVTLPRSVFPDISFPRVTVMATKGYTPVNLMLLRVTMPLEQAAKSTPGVTLVRSQTGNGLSKLHVYFAHNVNPDKAYLLLQARLAQVGLPTGTRLRVRPMMPNIFPFAEYALVSDTQSSDAMMPLFGFKVRPALLDIPGVYTVQGIGRGWPEIGIQLDSRRLAQYGLSSTRVAQVLKDLQGPYYAGQLYGYHRQFLMVTQSRPATIQALRQVNIPLGPFHAGYSDRYVRLDQLGTVSQRAPPWIRAASVSGYRHALLVDIASQAGVNVQAVSQQVTRQIAQLRASLPDDVKLVKIYDFSDLVRSSLGDVWTALLLGTLITCGVLLLFLRRLDTALATLVIVPLSMGATLVVLKAMGFGLNIMTLGGITAAIGVLVDHAIVVVEHAMKRSLRGASVSTRRDLALTACGEILPVMTFATLTSALVFIPLVFLSGTIGILFRQMAIALVVALVISQGIALTLTPILAIWLSRRRERSAAGKGWRWARRMVIGYDRSLRAGLARPWLALPVVVLILLITWVAWRELPTAFLPSWDEGAIAVPFRTATGSSVAETLAVGRKLIVVAMRNPAVDRVSLIVGQSLENPRAVPSKGDLMVMLKPQRKLSTDQVIGQLRQAFKAADPNLGMLKLHQVLINELGNLSGAHAPLEVLMFGRNPDTLFKWGNRAANALKASNAFANVTYKTGSTGPRLDILPRARARLLGLTSRGINQQVKNAFWGEKVGFLLQGEQVLPLRLQIDLPLQDGYAALQRDLWIQTVQGAQVPLGAVAHVRLSPSIPYVTHQNLAAYTYIQLRPKTGEGLNQAAAHARQVMKHLHLPSSVSVTMGGYYKEQTRSFREMGIILVAALGVLLIMVGLQLGSQRAAWAVLLGTSLSAVGALWMLVLRGIPLDSTAFLGMLLVFAIVVNNGILIFSLARPRPGEDQVRPFRIVLACRQRLRPILMTMAADVMGFLPLVVGIGHGTDLLKPLATAVTGGLVIAIFMSLFLAPVIFIGISRLTVHLRK